MPTTDIIYFRETDGSVPVLEWIDELSRRERRAAVKCLARIELLRQQGSELRRPIVDYLRDGIYELRIRVGRSQHRVLYFFRGKDAVVLVHALTKERQVPEIDIERALERKQIFDRAPARHTYRED